MNTMCNDVCLECWTYTEYCNCGKVQEKRYSLTLEEVQEIMVYFSTETDWTLENIEHYIGYITND